MDEPILDLDVRRLEPPQPLIRILNLIAAAGPRTVVRAHTDRRPMLLYPQLEHRGFSGETEAQTDGSYITTIRHR